MAIWSLGIPNEVEHFLWNGCTQTISMCYNLNLRGVLSGAWSPRCQEEIKRDIHCFFECDFAKKICSYSPFADFVLNLYMLDFLSFFLVALDRYGKVDFELSIIVYGCFSSLRIKALWRTKSIRK